LIDDEPPDGTTMGRLVEDCVLAATLPSRFRLAEVNPARSERMFPLRALNGSIDDEPPDGTTMGRLVEDCVLGATLPPRFRLAGVNPARSERMFPLRALNGVLARSVSFDRRKRPRWGTDRPEVVGTQVIDFTV
jgi:hypothetical protein